MNEADNEADEKGRGIIIGYPFDQLIDRECDLEHWKEDQRGEKRKFVPGIKLPGRETPGTGNIIICGPAGSGKSTLALQWAVKCAVRDDNRANAAFFSLENTVEEVRSKAKSFGWDRWLDRVKILDSSDELSDPDCWEDILKGLLSNRWHFDKGPGQAAAEAVKGDFTRRVLLCALSPRPVKPGNDHDRLFWRRYQQLERLLSAADRLSEKLRAMWPGTDKLPFRQPRSVAKWTETEIETWRRMLKAKESGVRKVRPKCDQDLPGPVMLPLVVVDSLNMFGTRPLNRDELYGLFSLFRKYRRIGVFVVESTQESPFDSTMADVVVSLSEEKDRGYEVHHFEVEKSRYYNQVTGLHPYKTSSVQRAPGRLDKEYWVPAMPGRSAEIPRQGVVVFPSLHYVVLRTEQTEAPSEEELPSGHREIAKEGGSQKGVELSGSAALFAIKGFETILPRNLGRGSVYTIVGPRGTFKSSFAMNFLAAGLLAGESGLLLRLSDIALMKADQQTQTIPLSEEIGKKFRKRQWCAWTDVEAGGGKWSNFAGKHKVSINLWQKAGKKRSEPTLFELDFKGGMLLPEELVEIVRNILFRRAERPDQKIRRVVLDNVSQIGVSYPFLQHSTTTGDIFLSAFVHIMRNAGVDLVMVGTTVGIDSADEIVKRAGSLADAVISCRFCDVFGDRHVLVEGEGLLAGQGDPAVRGESVPGIVRVEETSLFRVDTSYLEGLVGFETGRIHRPGLLIHFYKENGEIHGPYNKEIEKMIQAGLAPGVPPDVGRRLNPDQDSGMVEVVDFSARDSEAVHNAIEVLHREGKPLDRTVVFTVDEFGMPERDAKRWVRLDNINVAEENEFLLDKTTLLETHGGFVSPYYANLLLLVYRNDVGLNESALKSWWSIATALESVGVAGSAASEPPGTPHKLPPSIRRRFWVDIAARETLTCMFLDAFYSAEVQIGNRPSGPPLALSGVPKGSRLASETGQELRALVTLLSRRDPWRDDDEKVLPEDSAVYVCWYSQLRELLERWPALGGNIGVSKLPGGGFKGDWFLGISAGSVSRALGRQIVRMLCSKEEDYRRFARGVGLPTRTAFYNPSFLAWPRCSVLDQMKKLHGYWKEANSRRAISDYPKIRTLLFTRARRLTAPTVDALSPEDLLSLCELDKAVSVLLTEPAKG